MTTYSVIAVGAAILTGATLSAQEQSAQATQTATVTTQRQATAEARNQAPPAPVVPLKVAIVLSKYQGEKKVSSEPYELSVRTDGSKASIRMTTQVPLLTMNAPVPPPPPGTGGSNPAPAPRIGPFTTMRDVGTNMDCSARTLDDGRFAVTVTIEDASIYEDNQRNADGSKTESVRSVRTFRTTNALVLRDGQTSEFTAATDKVHGEMIKAAVTLTVMK